MPNADIEVIAELELVKDQFKSDLANLRAEFQTVADDLESTSINVPVRMNDLLTTQVMEAIQTLELQEVVIPVRFETGGNFIGDMSGANALATRGNSGWSWGNGSGGGGGGGSDVMDADWEPSGQRYLPGGTDLAIRGNTGWQWGAGSERAISSAEVDDDEDVDGGTVVRNGGGSGSGGSRGGSGGGRLGRMLALGAVHAASEIIKNEEAYGERVQDADGDETKLLKAEIAHRTDYDSAFLGAGRIGRFLRESVESSLGEQTTSDLEEEVHQSQYQDSRATEQGREIEDNRRRSQQESIESATSSFAKSDAEIEGRRADEQDSLKTENAKRQAALTAERDKRIADADLDFTKAVHEYTNQNIDRDQLGDAEDARDAAYKDATSLYDTGITKLNDWDTQRKGMIDQTAERDTARNARGLALETAEGQDRVNDIGAMANEATQRASGDAQGADNAAYVRKLDDEVKHLRDLADATDDVVKKKQLMAEADAQAAANPTLIAARQAEELREQTYADSRFAVQRGDIIASANESVEASQGQTRKAGDDAYKRSIDDRIGNLRDQANNAANINTRNQLNSTADTLQQEEPTMLGARRDKEDLADARSTWEIEEGAYEQHLRNMDQGFAAEEAAINAHFDKLKALRQENGKETGSVEEARTEATKALDKQYTDRAEHEEAETQIARARRENRGSTADVAQIQEDYRLGQREAGGNAALEAANRHRTEERLQQFLHPQARADFTSTEDIYDKLQLGVAEDTTGHAGRDAQRARQGAQGWLRDLHDEDRGNPQGAQQPPPNDPVAWNKGSQDANNATQDQAAAENNQAFAAATKDFSDATKKFSDKLDSAQKLVVIS